MATYLETTHELAPEGPVTCPECGEFLWDASASEWMPVCPQCGWEKPLPPADQPIDVTQFDEFWVDNESWRDYTNAAEL